MLKKSYFYNYFAKTVYDHFYGLKQINPFQGCPINRKENIKPFFIIGSGRSGNTLLRRILDSHPDLHIPPETYVLGQTIRVFRRNRHLPWRDLVYLTLSQFQYHPEFETFDIELRPLAESLLSVPSESRSLALILDRFYRYYSVTKGDGCKRWGDKTPINTFSLDFIFNVFPKAQFIHIIRDGCDVVPSYVRAGIYKNIDNAAKRWLNSINCAKKFAKKYQNSCLEVKYESLVSHPEIAVAQICNFLNIEYESSMLNSNEHAKEMGDVILRKHHNRVLEPISVSSIGKGRKQLSHQEKIFLQRIIGRKLEELGYEPCIC